MTNGEPVFTHNDQNHLIMWSYQCLLLRLLKLLSGLIEFKVEDFEDIFVFQNFGTIDLSGEQSMIKMIYARWVRPTLNACRGFGGFGRRVKSIIQLGMARLLADWQELRKCRKCLTRTSPIDQVGLERVQRDLCAPTEKAYHSSGCSIFGAHY